MSRAHTILLAFFSVLVLYAAGLGLRRAVLEAQYEAVGDDMPFTLESALQYRRLKMVFDTGRLPAVDAFVEHPAGVRTWRTYTVGSEYVYAALARLFPSALPVPARVRWIESGWFCLGIGFMFLWLLWWRRSWWAAWAAGLFYAVSLSAVIRSTGQELSSENFALPFLVAHLACSARARRLADGGGRWRSWAAASAGALALAMASWDLVQFYVFLWALRGTARALRTVPGTGAAGAARAIWLAELGGLAFAGLAVPYLRAHGLLVSPGMGLAYGAAALPWIEARLASMGRPLRQPVRLAALLAPAAIALLAGLGSYGESYAHFASLLWAKARFLNVKPADPGLLSFDQRIMWVPALHGADWRLTWQLLPGILPASSVAAFIVFRARPGAGIASLLFFCGSSFLAFVLFARFHVFLAVFASALIGVWAGESSRRGGWMSWAVAAVLGAGAIVETVHVAANAEKWGRPNVYYKELDELGDWLAQHASPDPVLANFGVSGYIAAYGKCPVLLHPKFESAAARAAVREYAEHLFAGTERSLRDWADARGARYLVYSKGEFSSAAPELQMRYMVNALEPPADAPARGLEFEPERARYFRLLWSNRKYAVFDILLRSEEAEAAERAGLAAKLLSEGDLDWAEREAVKALKADPRQERAADVMLHVESLRHQGFGGRPQGGR
jgi:hypothetical protein